MKKTILIMSLIIMILVPIPAYADDALNEAYQLRIDNLDVKLTDVDIDIDFWNLRVIANCNLTLYNSGDTEVSLQWQSNRISISANTTKVYNVSFVYPLSN